MSHHSGFSALNLSIRKLSMLLYFNWPKTSIHRHYTRSTPGLVYNSVWNKNNPGLQQSLRIIFRFQNSKL